MVAPPRRVQSPAIVTSDDAAVLLKACPDLEEWPMRWQSGDSDIAPGRAIVEIFKPFLLDLLQRKIAKRSFNQHRDHLWMLGGEIIRRRLDDPDLKRLPIKKLVDELIEDEGGPLIWPRITEAEQNAFDATCRKLYRFLNPSTSLD
jgi:hypothetical protein